MAACLCRVIAFPVWPLLITPHSSLPPSRPRGAMRPPCPPSSSPPPTPPFLLPTVNPNHLLLPLPSKPRRLLASASKPPHHHRHRRIHRRRLHPSPPSSPPTDAAASTSGDYYYYDDDDLEAAIYDFMRGSGKPSSFPTRAELLAAGRVDLADAVASRGGWLALGWSDEELPTDAAVMPPYGVHPDYPPEASASDGPPGAGSAASEAEASSSGRPPETTEAMEVVAGAGLEGMLSRLERERARLPPQRVPITAGQEDNGVLIGHSGAPVHTVTHGRNTPTVSENGNTRALNFHSQNRTLEGNNTLSSANDTWRTWTLNKGGFSDFEAAVIHPTDSRELSEHNGINVASAENNAHIPSNGVVINGSPRNGIDSERDEIRSRLQNLELDLTSALNSLRSRFDNVLLGTSNDNSGNELNEVSDDWEFEETKLMHAQDELRSIRAKIAVLEGKMALDIIEKQKIIEEKQRRLDAAEKALSLLHTVYIVWPSSASDVQLVGSFDGWTNQRKMERSEGGIFSINLRLYPGKYEIKFIVDGAWRIDPLRPTVRNNGHENNLLIVP